MRLGSKKTKMIIGIALVVISIIVAIAVFVVRQSASAASDPAADAPNNAASSTPAQSTPTPSTPAQSTPAGPVVHSTGRQVLVVNAIIVAANYGDGGYDVATKDEVQEHNPSRHRGNWHWVRTAAGSDDLVKMANYGSVEEPDWQFLTFQTPRTTADYVYVIKRT